LKFCNAPGIKNYNDAPTRRSKTRDDVSIRLDRIPTLDWQNW